MIWKLDASAIYTSRDREGAPHQSKSMRDINGSIFNAMAKIYVLLFIVRSWNRDQEMEPSLMQQSLPFCLDWNPL
jgi:hypothetical protein